MRRRAGAARGLSLIELLISISIVAVALASSLAATGGYLVHSATPAIRSQALAIASAYLEEISTQPYSDPDGSDSGSCEEAARSDYDDLNDYACIADNGARDFSGTAIAGLDGYRIAVRLSAATLHGANGQWVVVSVSHDGLAGAPLRLQTWRAQLP